MNEPTNRADNVLLGPWLDPALQREREELILRLGAEEALRLEHVVWSRNVVNPLPNYQLAVLEALSEAVADLAAKYPGRVGW